MYAWQRRADAICADRRFVWRPRIGVHAYSLRRYSQKRAAALYRVLSHKLAGGYVYSRWARGQLRPTRVTAPSLAAHRRVSLQQQADQASSTALLHRVMGSDAQPPGVDCQKRGRANAPPRVFLPLEYSKRDMDWS